MRAGGRRATHLDCLLAGEDGVLCAPDGVDGGLEGADLVGVAGRARILVVDDKEENLYLLRALLQGHGHQPVLAHNGAEALSRAGEERPDLVISDILMPVMDGFAAAQEIRASGPEGEVPIVALTASALEADRERCFAAGMNDFLSKPLRRDALASAVVAWIPNGGAVEGQPNVGEPRREPEDDVLDPELVDYKGFHRYHAAAVEWLSQHDDGAPLATGYPWIEGGIQPGDS